MRILAYYPRNAMLARVLAVVVSVCPSVTRRYCVMHVRGRLDSKTACELAGRPTSTHSSLRSASGNRRASTQRRARPSAYWSRGMKT